MSKRYGSTDDHLRAEFCEAHIGQCILVNTRPNFLKNPLTGRNLEYHCYDLI